jgi:CRP-like cAMP-binding protein
LQLVRHCYQASRERGAKIDLMCCAPNMVRLYEQLGYRRYLPPVEDRAGIRIPMALIAGDVDHLKAVRSPLLPAARKLPDDPALSDWFQRTFAEHRSFVSPVSVVSPVSLGDERFMEIMSARIKDGETGLMEGLDKGERDTLLAAMTRSEIEPGSLTRRGDTGKEIYLILDGVAEARVRDQLPVLLLATYGRGNVLGEIATISGKQTVDLSAKTKLHIASLDEEGLDRFVKTQPAIAAKLLRNLPRVLSERLVVTSDQLAVARRADRSPLTSAWSIWSVGPRDRLR